MTRSGAPQGGAFAAAAQSNYGENTPSGREPQAPDLRSRRARRFAIRWRRPTITTDDALEVLEAFAARHGGDERAALGELIALLVERAS